jgi:hypothetical protein
VDVGPLIVIRQGKSDSPETKKKNPAASARDRLLALAREQGEDFQLVLTRYGLEHLLYRWPGSV